MLDGYHTVNHGITVNGADRAGTRFQAWAHARRNRWVAPQARFNLHVEDVDAVYARAVAAGATARFPVMDMFWGDRVGRVVDPFGHEWAISTHKEDVSIEEVARRAQEFFSKMPAAGV